MRNSFRRRRRGYRFVHFVFFRPDSRCRIGLFPLNFWHLAEWMLFARYAKQQQAERNSDDALAKEASHNALAQLSASGLACKDESAAAVVAFDSLAPTRSL